MGRLRHIADSAPCDEDHIPCSNPLPWVSQVAASPPWVLRFRRGAWNGIAREPPGAGPLPERGFSTWTRPGAEGRAGLSSFKSPVRLPRCGMRK